MCAHLPFTFVGWLHILEFYLQGFSSFRVPTALPFESLTEYQKGRAGSNFRMDLRIVFCLAHGSTLGHIFRCIHLII
jgi:hypothetical protein